MWCQYMGNIARVLKPLITSGEILVNQLESLKLSEQWDGPAVEAWNLNVLARNEMPIDRRAIAGQAAMLNTSIRRLSNRGSGSDATRVKPGRDKDKTSRKEPSQKTCRWCSTKMSHGAFAQHNLICTKRPK